MRRKRTVICIALCLLGSLLPTSGSAQSRLFALRAGQLDELEPTTLGTIATTPLTSSGGALLYVNCAAVSPATGDVLGAAIFSMQPSTMMVSIDIVSGLVAPIGTLSQHFESISFAGNTLYGVAPIDDATTVFTIPPAPPFLQGTSALTARLAYRTIDGQLYRAYGPPAALERIDPATGTVVQIPLSVPTMTPVGPPMSLTYLPDVDEFLLLDGNAINDVFRVTPAGVVTHAHTFGVPVISLFGMSAEVRRGDCNSDGNMNLADAITLLNHLFPATPPAPPLPCHDACDGNDDGQLDLADAIAMLTALFPQPTGPAPMLGDCAVDATADALGCAGDSTCP
ncbi:MAG: hypothetical protein AAF581_03910 [Planctomycetota bacterium]